MSQVLLCGSRDLHCVKPDCENIHFLECSSTMMQFCTLSRRYESLDNLNSARSWRHSPWPPSPAPSSSGGDGPQSAVSSSASSHGYTRSISSTLPTSSSMGSLRQSPWSQPWSQPSPTSPTSPADLNKESSPEPEPRPPSQRRRR